ncbi:MAG TPA: NAD(P)/FAD-dependent oxidoreductase [Candidatus Limnocylindrales bacterium]|nr:NAD(P)/FAD-dependent oxidoreductase [Candidatus Limnocylindrales bacterium]
MATRTTAYDAIVIGAGHNGLVAAAYMARAGLKVLVLEARDRVGGATVTEELMPGVRVPSLAHTVGRLRASIARELELGAHGMALVAPECRVFAPQPDGRAVTLWSDLGATVDSLRAWSEEDATAYVEYDRRVRSLSRFLTDLGDEAPPEINAPGFGDALLGLRLGRAFRGLGTHDGRTILRVLAMAVADFVTESFDTEAIRATTAWRGVRYTAMGPWSAGTTQVLLGDAAGNDGGAAGETVFARGGPSNVAEAIAASALGSGAEIRTDARVAHVTTLDGAVTGVVLEGGEEIACTRVVSGLDPKQLLTSLVDPVTVGPSMRWRAGNIRTPGAVAKVNLVLDGVPTFPAAGDDARLLRGRIQVNTTSIDATERAFDASKYARVSDAPVLEATIPSLVDPSLVAGAADGTQVMSVLVQWMPKSAPSGDWAADRDTIGDLVIRTLETVAPGLGARVTGRQVLTPGDLEAEYGLSGGHPLHAEPALDSFFLWRPLLGWARYRMPVAGLYLAGSGAHPGGGVTGVPGRNAAQAVIADRKRRR